MTVLCGAGIRIERGIVLGVRCCAQLGRPPIGYSFHGALPRPSRNDENFRTRAEGGESVVSDATSGPARRRIGTFLGHAARCTGMCGHSARQFCMS